MNSKIKRKLIEKIIARILMCPQKSMERREATYNRDKMYIYENEKIKVHKERKVYEGISKGNQRTYF